MNTKFYTIQIEVNTKILKRRIRKVCNTIGILAGIYVVSVAGKSDLNLINMKDILISATMGTSVAVLCGIISNKMKGDR